MQLIFNKLPSIQDMLNQSHTITLSSSREGVAVTKPDTGVIFKAIRFEEKAKHCANFLTIRVRRHERRC